MPPVALCVVGAVRGMTRKEVYDYTLNNLARSLAPTNDTRADVFLLLQLAESVDSSKSTGTRANKFAIEDLGTAIRALRPVAMDISDRLPLEEVRKTPWCSRLDAAPHCLTGKEHACKYWPQARRWKTCFDMVQTYEAKAAQRYSWVAKIRPDIMLTNWEGMFALKQWLFPLHRLRGGLSDSHANRHLPESQRTVASPPRVLRSEIMSIGSEGMGTLKDNFVLVPREHAEAYFDAYLAYELCVPLETLYRSCHHTNTTALTGADMFPECLLTHWVRHVRQIPESSLAERIANKRSQVQNTA